MVICVATSPDTGFNPDAKRKEKHNNKENIIAHNDWYQAMQRAYIESQEETEPLNIYQMSSSIAFSPFSLRPQ